jgi:hypothetical protein
VLDNASYHNVKTEDTVCPNFSQKKAVLQNHLTQHNIFFSATDTKKVLYEKIKQKKFPVVSIDFHTTQEKQHYSSPGDGHYPLIWPETLNRSMQNNQTFAFTRWYFWGIRHYRCNYLRKIKSFREAGYDIVYMNETWVNQNHCTDYMWRPNDGSDAPKIPSALSNITKLGFFRAAIH